MRLVFTLGLALLHTLVAGAPDPAAGGRLSARNPTEDAMYEVLDTRQFSIRPYKLSRDISFAALDDEHDQPRAYFVLRDANNTSDDIHDIELRSNDYPLAHILARDITVIGSDDHDHRELVRRARGRRPTNPAGRPAKCGGFCSLEPTCPVDCRYCTGGSLPWQTKRCMKEPWDGQVRRPPGRGAAAQGAGGQGLQPQAVN